MISGITGERKLNLTLPILNTPETVLSLQAAQRKFRHCRDGVALKEIRQGKCLCVSRANPHGEHWWIDAGFDRHILLGPAPDTARYGHVKNWNYHRIVYENQINSRLMISKDTAALGAELAIA